MLNHVHLHNVRMSVHQGTLCILLPFHVPFRAPAFRLSQLPGKWSFKFRATVKAGTQERGTERGTEVMWLHTGNYDTGSYDQR